MKRKLPYLLLAFGGAVLAAACTLAAVHVFSARTADETRQKRSDVDQPVPEEGQEEIPPEEGQEEAPSGQVLRGRDFTLEAAPNGNPLYVDLAGSLADGTPLTELEQLDGKRFPLENIVFSAGTTFTLHDLLPGEPREQLVVESSTMLPEGQGTCGTYQVYRIVTGRLTAVLEVLTERSAEATEERSALDLEASVQPVMEQNRPAFVYRYRLGRGSERSLVFRWNGRRFVEPTGTYAWIQETFHG